MVELFNGLISSKTRIRILMRFFCNPGTSSYLRELAKEFEGRPYLLVVTSGYEIGRDGERDAADA